MAFANGFAADVDAVAELGHGADWIDKLADTGFEPGQFAGFVNLDRPARLFVLKVLGGLGGTTDEDWQEFNQRPDAKSICQWMITLPAFRKTDLLELDDEYLDEES